MSVRIKSGDSIFTRFVWASYLLDKEGVVARKNVGQGPEAVRISLGILLLLKLPLVALEVLHHQILSAQLPLISKMIHALGWTQVNRVKDLAHPFPLRPVQIPVVSVGLLPAAPLERLVDRVPEGRSKVEYPCGGGGLALNWLGRGLAHRSGIVGGSEGVGRWYGEVLERRRVGNWGWRGRREKLLNLWGILFGCQVMLGGDFEVDWQFVRTSCGRHRIARERSIASSSRPLINLFACGGTALSPLLHTKRNVSCLDCGCFPLHLVHLPPDDVSDGPRWRRG